ncbi:hypothetical protein PI124_g11607 [Phytophthora idaei]|nr:hypothetical protein PI124_g11607 [Phytophthora idaei]
MELYDAHGYVHRHNDGKRGNADTYKCPVRTSIQLADIYHREPGVPPIWESILINNCGRFNCTAAASRGANCSEDQPLKRFHFEAGKTYLLRLMSMSALAPFEFSIGGQELRIIATATATRSSRRS